MKASGAIRAWPRGVCLALTLVASGERATGQGVIHTVPPSPLFYSDLPSSQNIDLNNDGIPDFNLSSPNTIEINLTPLNNNALLAVPQPPPDLGGWLLPMTPGSEISSSLNPVAVWFDRLSPGGTTLIVASANIGSIGYFRGSTNAYAGLRLEVSGDYYYGWLHIQNLGVNWGQVTEWAYESTPNTPIFAGQVPEPSISVLFAIGTLTLAIQHRRKSL